MTDYRDFLIQNCAHRKLGVVVSLLLLGFYVARLDGLYDSLKNIDYNGFLFTELIINYAGGFVRRGLLGSGIHLVSRGLGVHPACIVIPFVVAMYGAVVSFFFVMFKKRKLCWWLLLSPLLLGNLESVMRKDFLMVASFILMIWLIRPGMSSVFKRFVALILASATLLCHEAFLFWGIPVYFMLIVSDRKHIVQSFIAIIVVLCTAWFAFTFKGEMDVACAIVDSWNPLMNNELDYERNNSIGALGWDAAETMIMHLRINFYFGNGSYMKAVYRAMTFLLVYYMVVNFLFVFKLKGSSLDESDRINLGAVVLLQGICLLPLFTVLSCDYIRVYQYITLSTMAVFLIVDKNVLKHAFPQFYLKAIAKFNRLYMRCLSPTKGLLLLMLFIVNESDVGFNAVGALANSIAGFYIGIIYTVLRGSICIPHLMNG